MISIESIGQKGSFLNTMNSKDRLNVNAVNTIDSVDALC